MAVLELGRHLLLLATILCAGIFVLALIGRLLRDRRWVVSARCGFYALLLLMGGSAACLVHGFFTGQYNNEYIRAYSERSLGAWFKLAGLWAGLDGSMLFWCLILCGYAAIAALQHRWSARDPVGRRLEPYVYMVLAGVIFFFALVVYKVTNPFEVIPLRHRLGLSPDGMVPDGRGLNPQLENYWMAIHPPCLYLGLVGFTVPFAFAVASLLAGEMGDYWIKIVRRWTLVAWTFLTVGIILGGLWAYEMLGWGGYWAWDPVENASILPWFVGTAFLHSVMVQERRDMLKGWNVFLIFLTFFMTVVATYMTRSGVVSSVHAFSEGKVDVWFLPFLLGTGGLGAFLIGLRAPLLRGRHQLESFLSREAAFFFNNLILLALMVVVYFISMFQKISHDFLAQELTVRESAYNLITTPLFLVLLLLTGLGPQLGWVKTSRRLLWKRTLWPALAGVAACGAALPWWILQDEPFSPAGGAAGAQVYFWKTLFTNPGAIEAGRLVHKLQYYSTLGGIGLSVFILGTVYAEFHRGAMARVRHRGEGVLEAGMNLVLGNNRRYGGYLVHVGIAILAIGVIWSSNFRTKDEFIAERGHPMAVKESGHTLTYQGVESLAEGNPYQGKRVSFEIHRKGKLAARLQPEWRLYTKQESNIISIPAIQRGLINDYYIHITQNEPQPGSVAVTIFINPLVNWIWLGTVLMLLGGIFAAIPMPRRRMRQLD